MPKDGKKKTRKFRDPLKENLIKLDKQDKEARESAARTDVLLQEEAGFLEAEGMEKTIGFRQDDIVKEVDVGTARKRFDLKLDQYGPYTLDYTRNGRGMLIGGLKGHVAMMDWQQGRLECELFLNETVHAVKFLHNNQFFAVAQKRYTFIYDKTGMELHRLHQHVDSTLLDFLPYHMLLVTAGNTGMLKYHDTSTGELVSEIRTKLGPTQAMRQNPWNGVMHLGHANGTVGLWTPNMSTPVVKIRACRGPVRSLAVNRDGRYMAVCGADKTLKIWDIRKFEEMVEYHTPTQANTVDISDRGLVAVGWGPNVTVWKDVLSRNKQDSPYMSHLSAGSRVNTARFVPFEDVLGFGHAKGVSSIIIPGAGEANFDALEINPFESAKQRQESEVRSLMNKLPADMITLDPEVVGTVDRRKPQERLTAKEKAEERDKEAEKKPLEDFDKMIRPNIKAKNSSLRRLKRKQRNNMITERSKRIEKALEKEKELRIRKEEVEKGVKHNKDKLSKALSRFD